MRKYLPRLSDTLKGRRSSSGLRWCWHPDASKYLAVKIKIAWVGKTKEPAIQALTDEYLKRISRYVPVESVVLRDENALLELCGRAPAKSKSNPGKSGGGKSTLVLMDSRGKQLSSEEFARF